ncbi:MAG: ATP-dependent Clp protease ATP-binding subunit, partial [Prochlorococcus sp.]|nr:ATP-dependent Clp protease ATP-binding subunit [Prochlorococcus sp.]
VGRHSEIDRVIQILGRRTKNNPVLIGEPGVGKTAIAEGLAQRIQQGDIPDILEEKRVLTLDIGLLVAGTKYRGEFEERLKKIMEEIKAAGNVILLIDEVHTLIGAGAAEGAIDAANILKPALARGELQCIGATTLDEYRKHIERDAALERRFQPVMVGEPSIAETIEILHGLRERYEQHHRLKITDEALEAAANLGDRYISDRYLPDKAIDLIDEAGSRVRLLNSKLPPAAKEVDKELRKVQKEKEDAVRDQDFTKAGELREKEVELREKIRTLLQSSRQDNDASATAETSTESTSGSTTDTATEAPQDVAGSSSFSQEISAQQQNENAESTTPSAVLTTPVVNEEDIAHIVASWTGVPVQKLTESESMKLLNMEETLHQRLIGQDEAVKSVSKAIRRARVGLKNPNRPIASFIFSGPTGVGKTELTKALATYFFGSEEAMIRLDMSEFMERHTVSKLIGSPPGYVGFNEGGQLTEAVRRRPYTVVLFDEIEKAHPDVFNLLLQLLEDGRLTDSKGRTVDFKNTLIIMTSNIGSKVIEKGGGGLGFEFSGENAEENQYNRIKSLVNEELKQYFRPEFLNRLDEIIVFRQLSRDEVKDIAEIMLKEVFSRIEDKGITLTVSEAFKERLVEEGYNPSYGARPLRRAVMRLLEDSLAEEVLTGRIKDGDTAEVDVDENKKVVVRHVIKNENTPQLAGAGV